MDKASSILRGEKIKDILEGIKVRTVTELSVEEEEDQRA